MSPVERDPYSANNFEVDLGAGPVGFADVSGLGYEIDYLGEAARRKPTARVCELSLKRGVTGDLAVWQWVRETVDGHDRPRTVTITLLDARRAAVCTWVLRGARPTKWIGPALSAGATAVAIEELVLTADSIDFDARTSD